MIFDREENLSRYMNRADAEKIYGFIRSIDEKTEKGKYVIDGERLYAIVSEYETKSRSDAVLEVHNKYLDLHFLIFGEEKQEFYDRREVKEAVPYNAVNEAALCVFPDERNELILRPGFFTLYFTDDAHAPQLAVGSPGIVRKVVVKAAAAGFQNDPL